MNRTQTLPKKDMRKAQAASQATFAQRRLVAAIGEINEQGYRVILQRDGEDDRVYSPDDLHP
jgi:hypothetical protein